MDYPRCETAEEYCPSFKCASAPRFLRATKFHGPNTSTPKIVNGDDSTTLFAGRSAIICWAEGLRSFTHWCNKELKIFLALIIQKPWDRKAPSVNTLSYCCTFSWNLITSKTAECDFLSMMIGCFWFMCNGDWLRRPPTLRIPSLSRKGFSCMKALLRGRGVLSFKHLISSLNEILWELRR